jgi:hypothetical protein
MTGQRRKLCRIVSAAAIITCVLATPALAVLPIEKDGQTVKHLELSRWKCTTPDSCATIRSIAISGSYALIDWRTVHSGGEALWHKVNGKWHRLTGAGGSMGARELQHYGVPHDVASELIRTRDL